MSIYLIVPAFAVSYQHQFVSENNRLVSITISNPLHDSAGQNLLPFIAE